MGLFKFLKEKLFKKKEKKEEEVKQAESIEKYDKGMAKSRKEFSSKLDELTKKYKVVNEDYFSDRWYWIHWELFLQITFGRKT